MQQVTRGFGRLLASNPVAAHESQGAVTGVIPAARNWDGAIVFFQHAESAA